MTNVPPPSGKHYLIGEVKELEVERRIYTKIPNLDPIIISMGCPIENEICAQLEYILKNRDIKNIFIAIPYSDYDYENDIKDVLINSDLNPILAKDKIESKIMLCKVCREIRRCSYGVVDISSGNLNVVYELGIMQTLERKCAILFKRGSTRQTDLQGIENVCFSTKKELIETLSQWIKNNIHDINMPKLNKFVDTYEE